MRTHMDFWNGGNWGTGREWFGFAPVLDRLFDDVVNDENRRVHSSAVLTPACDIEETESHYLVSLDMPGISKEDIRIETKGDQLMVSAERKHESKEKNGSRFVSERSYGKFYRAFSVGNSIDRDHVEAVYKDGVLRIALPKAEETKPKQIPIGSDDKTGLFDRLIPSAKGKDARHVT